MMSLPEDLFGQARSNLSIYKGKNRGQVGPIRNLPSNNTICEMSEKDSEYDQNSRIIKRNETKSALSSCQSNLVPQKKMINSPSES